MRKKLKPEQDLESVQSDLIETVSYNYKNGVPVSHADVGSVFWYQRAFSFF